MSDAIGIELASVLDDLGKLGVDEVLITYDGSGDSGTFELEAAFRNLPAGAEINEYYGAALDAYKVDLPAELEARLADYIYDLMPGGWELDDGSYGHFLVDVVNSCVKQDHNERYTDVTSSSEEWDIPKHG